MRYFPIPGINPSHPDNHYFFAAGWQFHLEFFPVNSWGKRFLIDRTKRGLYIELPTMSVSIWRKR